jgi:hypothetical protein
VTEPSDPTGRHLELAAVARYVSRTLRPGEREEVERHLADCTVCAGEIGDLIRLRDRVRRPRQWIRLAPAVAAAAVVLLIVWTGRPRLETPTTRELPLTSVVAPTPLPVQPQHPTVLRWSTVRGAIGYRVVLYDSLGQTLLETERPDTMLALPDSLDLVPGGLYLWKIEAEASPDRWTSSELARFRAVRAAGP